MKERDLEQWIPIVSCRENGFTFTPEFMNAVGPLWGTSWEIIAFVAHVVGFFNDPLEHLLDFPPDNNSDEFDIEPIICEELAAKYREEFLDLPPEWYRNLFRAKLASLRLPVQLIEDAKLAHFKRYYNHVTVIRGLVNMLDARKPGEGSRAVHQVTGLLSLKADEAWPQLEEVVRETVSVGLLDSDDLSELLGDVEEWARSTTQ